MATWLARIRVDGQVEGTERIKSVGSLALPASMSAKLSGYQITRDNIGKSNSAVYQLHGDGNRPGLYLKHGATGLPHGVADEAIRLRWLSEHVAVPEICDFWVGPDDAWLLMEALRGQTAYQTLMDRPEDHDAIVDAISEFLTLLHAVPMSECPFDAHGIRLAAARQRIEAGLVDSPVFDAERKGWTAEQVWDQMIAVCPMAADRVVTHGDFTPDNLIMDGSRIVGCIDVGGAGLADRYQDLAIMWRNLDPFGPALQQRFLESYGIKQPDQSRLHVHLLLDEFF